MSGLESQCMWGSQSYENQIRSVCLIACVGCRFVLLQTLELLGKTPITNCSKKRYRTFNATALRRVREVFVGRAMAQTLMSQCY